VLTIPIEELGQEHNITKEYVLADGKILSLRAFSYEKTNAIPQKTYTKWFDYDKINGHLTLRTRQPGDYFYLDDRKRQTVKAYMINNKIPQEERGNILMLAREEHVLWMAGYRISSFYKVSEHTCRVLEVTVHMPTDAQGQSEQ
jgi:tRNA(Ile)-lysidine synthase